MNVPAKEEGDEHFIFPLPFNSMPFFKKKVRWYLFTLMRAHLRYPVDADANHV